MTLVDNIYFVYYSWYDRDTAFMKKKNAAIHSSFLLSITISGWLLLLLILTCQIIKIPFEIFEMFKYPLVLGAFVIYCLCHWIYVIKARSLKVFIYYRNLGKGDFSKKILLIYILVLIIPIVFTPLLGILWKK